MEEQIMTKKDLVSGMFGKDNEGSVFVVAGSRLIFEEGTYNDFDDMNDALEFVLCGAYVESLYEAACFDEVKDGNAKLIWKREEKKEEKPTKSNGAITITEAEFAEISEKVNAEWMRIAAEQGKDDGIVNSLITIQNATFAAHLAAELFGHLG
jgi:hypothetical protein